MNTKMIAITALTIGFLGLSGTALAYQGDYTQKGPNYSVERHEAMEKAFENNDYEAWKNQMQGRGRVTQVVTKENFSKFAQAHKLAEDGKYEEADKVREELGLRTRNSGPVGAGFGGGQGNGPRDGSCMR